MELAIEGYNNSSVHILLSLAYSMQGILESVNIGIIHSDIVFMSSTNITSTPEESWKHRCSNSKLCPISFQLLAHSIYIVITVWLHLFSFQI